MNFAAPYLLNSLTYIKDYLETRNPELLKRQPFFSDLKNDEIKIGAVELQENTQLKGNSDTASSGDEKNEDVISPRKQII